MSSELLLELPGKIVKSCALPQSTGPHLKLALLVVQTDSISIIHGDNGSLYHHYNFGRKSSYGAIVDCTFVGEKSGALVVVPLECKDVSALPHRTWTNKPERLFCADGHTVVAHCTGGYTVSFTLSESGELPQPPSSWGTAASAGSAVAVHAGSKYAAVVTHGGAASSQPASATPAGKKRKATSASDVGSVKVSIWEVPAPLEGSVVVFSSQYSKSASLALQEDERVIDVVCHHSADCVSIVTSLRWIKLSCAGDALFERDLRHITPTYATEAGDQLCFLGAERQLHLYDTRYGTETRSVAVTDPNAITTSSSSWLVMYPADASKSTAAVASTQLITCRVAGGSSSLFKRVVSVDAQARGALRTSLCNSIGKLAARQTSDAAAPLSSADMRQLQAMVAAHAHSSDSQNGDSKRHASIPQPTGAAFLSAFEQRCQAAVQAQDVLSAEPWEWELVKLLASSGDLSLSKNKSLVSVAAKARRLDVLAAVVEFVSDLSERQCVQVLAHVMLMPDADLANVVIRDGVVQYTEGAATETKKAKKSKSAAETTATGAVDGSVRVNVLRCLTEAVFRRTSAFSTTLLSEAVRVLSLSTAVVLLRVVVHFMRGLTEAEPASATDTLSATVTDEQMKRAATWAEALLDGHFSALALHAVSHAATRRALMSALDTVRGAEEAAEQVQTALGLWTHVNRVIRKGGQQVKPITSLYQVEHLDLR